MGSSGKPLALIAGSTKMPMAVATEARSRGRRILALAVEGITDSDLDEVVDEVRWLQWGDVGGLFRTLGTWRLKGVREAVMAGKVEQQRIYDDEGGSIAELTANLDAQHTDDLIGVVAGVLGEAGIELLDSSQFLEPYLVDRGVLTARAPDERERADIEHGWRIAKALGKVDVGQTVVVKERAVVAVEAMEGTDACIRRAGELSGPGAVVVKVAKPDQDRRFDLPVVGLETVATMVGAGAGVLAIEAGSTVVFDREELVERADLHDLAVVVR